MSMRYNIGINDKETYQNKKEYYIFWRNLWDSRIMLEDILRSYEGTKTAKDVWEYLKTNEDSLQYGYEGDKWALMAFADGYSEIQVREDGIRMVNFELQEAFDTAKPKEVS